MKTIYDEMVKERGDALAVARAHRVPSATQMWDRVKVPSEMPEQKSTAQKSTAQKVTAKKSTAKKQRR